MGRRKEEESWMAVSLRGLVTSMGQSLNIQQSVRIRQAVSSTSTVLHSVRLWYGACYPTDLKSLKSR